jgi:hypothetical protein
MPNEALQAALRSRNRADRSAALGKLVLAVPATLFGVLFANGLMLIVLGGASMVGLPIPYGLVLLVYNLILAVLIMLDVRRHPVPTWHTPKYLQADGSFKGHEFGSPTPDHRESVLLIAELEHRKGAFAGAPLMTKVLDPQNVLARIRVIASLFANWILGGPRSVSRALALQRRITVRSARRAVASAESFLAWLSLKGSVPEPELQTHLARHPEQAEGFALARELDVVGRRRNPVEFHYHVR